jgi:methionyl aminopeptidase
VNTELVHGMARKDVILKSGDIFSIDIGMEWPYNPPKKNTDKARLFGYFTDTAITFAVGEVSEEIKKLLAVTKQALEVGIAAAKPGKSVASIGKAIEKYVDSEGDFGIVRDLVGHGVGHLLHEDPAVPNYYDPGLEEVILQPGMVIAIEPMISLGKNYHIKTKKDGWTIEMSDGSLCAHFEHSLVITREGNTVVTRRPQEQKKKLW